MPLIEWVQLAEHKADTAHLLVVEGAEHVPFDIRRVYYLVNIAKDKRRGFHAHKQLQQMAVCVHGSCKFLLDDGNEKKEVLLDKPQLGIMIRPYVWHEMFNFSEDCVLLVLASDHFNENDYIRNYDDFKNALP